MKKILSLLILTSLSLFAALEDDLALINGRLVDLNSSIKSDQFDAAEHLCTPDCSGKRIRRDQHYDQHGQ